jgi:hypothetical protein
MSLRTNLITTCACAAMALGMSAPAFATDPLPGDDIAPPLNVNIALFYNELNNSGAVAQPQGSAYSQHTHIEDDILVARYIRTFSLGSNEAGFQAFVPYVNFAGQQEGGTPNIPAPLPGFPAFGPGKAHLSADSGFGAPNVGLFDFVQNNPTAGNYLVVAPWVVLPVGNDNKAAYLNPSNQNWVYELEVGMHHEIFGTPSVPNLAIDLWGEVYDYADNNNSAYTSQTVYANNIPSIYNLFGITNPLQTSTSAKARFQEQPTEEVRVYVSYEIDPAIGAFITPGFYQSFGGKQTYTLDTSDHVNLTTTYAKGTKIDSGNRTNESQLRLYASTFVNPTTQVTIGGYYDVAAHGGPLDRTFILRIAHFF